MHRTYTPFLFVHFPTRFNCILDVTIAAILPLRRMVIKAAAKMIKVLLVVASPLLLVLWWWIPIDIDHVIAYARIPRTIARTTTAMTNNNPVQVYILAGQSNMVGMGSVTHLDKLIQCNCTSTGNKYRDTLWNGTGYNELDNVYMLYQKYHGKLTVSRTAGFAGGSDQFGTEVLFGWTMVEQQRDNSTNSTPTTILLIKVAYGGRDLAVDFRPPSAGMGDYGVDPDHYGWEYRVMINDTKHALNTIDQYIPNYNNSGAYELKGFVWFQGWNDLLAWPKVNEYESNLGHLIRDIRNELNQSDLPFVIGELGMHGPNPVGKEAKRVFALRAAQKNVCASDEFQNNTIFVPTAQYAVTNGTTYNGIYHYYGRADTYYNIGQAFGNAMYQIVTQTALAESLTAETEPPVLLANSIDSDSNSHARRTCHLFQNFECFVQCMVRFVFAGFIANRVMVCV